MSENMKYLLSHVYMYANYYEKKQTTTQLKNNVILSRNVDANYKPNLTNYQKDYSKFNCEGLVCYIKPNY
jgi:hypothetical protein